MKLSPEAVRKLLRVKEQILAQPHLYNQDIWAKETECGTVCCIAGRLAHNDLSSDDFAAVIDQGGNSIFEPAARALGLERAELRGLFTDWPAKFVRQYDAAKSGKRRAAVGAARIDAFIAEHTEAR